MTSPKGNNAACAPGPVAACAVASSRCALLAADSSPASASLCDRVASASGRYVLRLHPDGYLLALDTGSAPAAPAVAYWNQTTRVDGAQLARFDLDILQVRTVQAVHAVHAVLRGVGGLQALQRIAADPTSCETAPASEW